MYQWIPMFDHFPLHFLLHLTGLGKNDQHAAAQGMWFLITGVSIQQQSACHEVPCASSTTLFKWMVWKNNDSTSPFQKSPDSNKPSSCVWECRVWFASSLTGFIIPECPLCPKLMILSGTSSFVIKVYQTFPLASKLLDTSFPRNACCTWQKVEVGAKTIAVWPWKQIILPCS